MPPCLGLYYQQIFYLHTFSCSQSFKKIPKCHQWKKVSDNYFLEYEACNASAVTSLSFRPQIKGMYIYTDSHTNWFNEFRLLSYHHNVQRTKSMFYYTNFSFSKWTISKQTFITGWSKKSNSDWHRHTGKIFRSKWIIVFELHCFCCILR